MLLFFKLHVLQTFAENAYLCLVTRCFCFGQEVVCYSGRPMLSGIPFCTGNTLTPLADLILDGVPWVPWNPSFEGLPLCILFAQT